MKIRGPSWASHGTFPPASPAAAAGAPWHELDEDGCCAGEYASGSGHVEVVRQLLDWAVRAELVLGAASRRASAAPAPGPQGYLQERATYRDGQLVDAEGEAVMMTWEAPLMREHARILCAAKVGLGWICPCCRDGVECGGPEVGAVSRLPGPQAGSTTTVAGPSAHTPRLCLKRGPDSPNLPLPGHPTTPHPPRRRAGRRGC